MPKLLLFSSLSARTTPVVASAFAHAAVFAVAVGGHGASGRGVVPVDVEIPVELLSVPSVIEQPVAFPDSRADTHDDHEHAFPTHTHSYPVSADHDAHPHDPQIDHRHAVPMASPLANPEAHASDDLAAAASNVETATPDGTPHFTMVLGSSAFAPGGGTRGDGVGSSSGAGNAVALSADELVDESSVTERARLVSSVAPSYPSSARAAEIEADVLLGIVVGAHGGVLSANVVRGAGYGFDQAALDAVRAYRFSPARRAGMPVRVRMHWTVAFRLE